MRIFVASWFFPPSTSSEGIVAFKLLSHSRHHYDVCSALSNQWGYEKKLTLSSDNVEVFSVDTDSIEEWVEQSVDLFEKMHAEEPYDCLMTRSMPPESIEVGRRLKAKHPELKWAASFGDPISRVPWMMKDLLDKTCSLSKTEKEFLRRDLSLPKDCSQWIGRGDEGIRVLCEYKERELYALRNADLVIAPSGPQMDYMLCGMRRANVSIIGHSFDAALYPSRSDRVEKKRTELVFIGYADKTRSLLPVVQAVRHLQINSPEALDKLSIRFIGNIVDDSSVLIDGYYLNDVVAIESSVDYHESLRIMSQADWLIHIDGYFKEFSTTGGSVYFAGKLADYLGSGKPILGITGKHSPADRIISQAGGITFDSWDKQSIAFALERIANGTINPAINKEYRDLFASEAQAKKLDGAITKLFEKCPAISRTDWPACERSIEEKVLTICIPSYNVETCLDRCLHSLVACKNAEKLEILVINDGSADRTRDIALKYQEMYPGIVRHIEKDNGGHGSTINRALDVAIGRYFRVVDGDDWLDTRELGNIIDVLESFGSEVDLVSSDYIQVNTNTGSIEYLKKKSKNIEYGKVYAIEELNLTKEYLSMASMTYRTKVLKDSGIRLQEHAFYVDVEYQLIPLPWVKTVAFLSGSLYRYEVGNADQSVSKDSFVSRYEDHDRVMKRILSFYELKRNSMTDSLDAYFKTLILDNLLNTHYQISMLFDSDRTRGLLRASEFDAYLKTEHSELYELVGKKYPTIMEARKATFSPAELPRRASLKYKKPTVVKKVVRSNVAKIMRGGVGSVIASEVTRLQKKK